MGEHLPRITFFTAENTATFWNFVFGIMYVIMPILIIWAATMYAGQLFAMVRRVFGARTTTDDPKNYDIKIKD